MKNNSVKRKAQRVLLKNRLYSLTDYNALRRVVESCQFTIIEYKKHYNTRYVSELIKKLGIESEVERNDSFLYLKNNLKFLFVNSDVSEQDKCSLLRHELGHICDPDLINADIHYSKIKKEEFANEFSLYIKNPGIVFKFCVLVVKKWKLAVCIAALTACVLGLFLMVNSLIIQPRKAAARYIDASGIFDDTYYVTSGGRKYHRDFCIIVKYRNNLTECTISEAVEDGYKPCSICVSQSP